MISLKKIIQSFIIFSLTSIISGQSIDKINFLNTKNFGSKMGIFLNMGSDQLDFDGFLDFQFSNGLYSEIWVSELDKNFQPNISSTLGWMKYIESNVILGCGISNYTYDNSNELFIASNYFPITAVAFLNIQNMGMSYLGILDLNYKFLDNLPFDISAMAILESSGIDSFFRLRKEFNSGINLGYTFSREKFETVEKKSIKKNGVTKFWDEPKIDIGYFNTIYIGVTF